MSNFERKYGKYAIKNLPLILIICYGVGYIFNFIAPYVVNYLYLDPYKILHNFQIWRLFSWVIVPPDRFDFWTIIVLYFYYSIGRSLESVWGTYRFNVYIFSGMLFTIIAAFILYLVGVPGIGRALYGQDLPIYEGWKGAGMISTYYINMSIFLAFAATFPNNYVYLFFILPIKVAFLGIVYGAFLIYDVYVYVKAFIVEDNTVYIAMGIVIVASLLNFLIFFITQRKRLHGNRGRTIFYESNSNRQKSKPQNSEPKDKPEVARHRCAICDKNSIDNPDVSFRFCSKCEGNYEYCSDHIFTHRHVGDRWNTGYEDK